MIPSSDQSARLDRVDLAAAAGRKKVASRREKSRNFSTTPMIPRDWRLLGAGRIRARMWLMPGQRRAFSHSRDGSPIEPRFDWAGAGHHLLFVLNSVRRHKGLLFSVWG